MIQSGGWNRLRTTDEHSKLARIAMDIPDAIEDLCQINVDWVGNRYWSSPRLRQDRSGWFPPRRLVAYL